MLAGPVPSFVWHSQAPLGAIDHKLEAPAPCCSRLFLSVLLVDRVLKGAEEDWVTGPTESYTEWLFHSRSVLSFFNLTQ